MNSIYRQGEIGLSVSYLCKNYAFILISALSIMLAGMGMQAHAAAGHHAYDLAGNFTIESNPHGPWSYGWESEVGGDFNLLEVTRVSVALNGVGIESWQYSFGASPSVHYNATEETAQTGEGPFEPGALWFVPGQNGAPQNFCVIRFTVPEGGAGRYLVQAPVRAYFPGAGDTDFHVLKNGDELFEEDLPAGDSSGGYTNEIHLVSGDRFDFVVGRGADGNQSSSALRINPVVSLLSPGPECSPVGEGLVGWWRFEGDVEDELGSQDGVLLGEAAYVEGVVGHGLSFDGVDDQVDLGASPQLNLGLGEGFSIEGWIKPTEVGSPQPIMEWNNRAGDVGLQFWISVSIAGGGSGSLFGSLPAVGGENHFISTQPGMVQAGQWQHVGLTYEKASGVARLYLNGAMVKEEALGTIEVQTSYDAFLGRRVAVSGTNFRYAGLMDEISVYGRSLNGDQMHSIAQAETAGKCQMGMPPGDVNLVRNGSFEIGVDPGISENLDAPDEESLQGWFVEAGSIDYIGSRWVAADGQRCLDLNGTGPGVISQMIKGLEEGSPYRLSFALAGNPELLPSLGTIKRMAAQVGELQWEFSFDATSSSVENLGWDEREVYFVPRASEMKLAFRGLMEGIGGAALDHVRIVRLGDDPPVACYPVPVGLVGWWPLDDSGEDIYSDNHGVLIGEPSFAMGQVGHGINMDGHDDYVLIEASPSLDVGLSAGMTVEGWINPDDATRTQPIVEWDSLGGSVGAHFWIVVDDEGSGDKRGHLFANLIDTKETPHWLRTEPNRISAGKFQHVALTYDKANGMARIFLNGAVMVETNLGMFTPLTSYPLLLGRRESGTTSNWRFQGMLDEISVYNRALDESEIAAIAHAGAAGKCRPVSAPLRPHLNISLVGRKAIIYWLGEGFELLESEFLNAGEENWRVIPTTGRHYIRDVSGGPRFYQLRRKQ